MNSGATISGSNALSPLAAALLAALSMGLVLPAAAQDRGQRLAYTVFADSGPEIRVAYDDGSGNRRLGPGSDASWSPDGQQLAFTLEIDGNRDIHVMSSVDGSGVTRLTTHPAGDHGASWSPDGSMIAFNSERSGSDQVWRRNVEAGTWGAYLVQLTQDTDHGRVNNFLSWSPDGTRILFSSDMHGDPQSGDYDIYIMNVDGSEQARLTQTPGAASYPTMSPDGQKIAYSYNEEDGNSSRIMIMNADGSGQKMLIENGNIPRFAPR